MTPRAFFSILILSFGILTAGGCSQTPTDAGPLQYHQQYSGNVSTLYGMSAIGRKSDADGYAPDLKWRKSDGTLDSLSGQQGKIVLLNFWATWCGPCKNEMPDLESIHSTYGDSVIVLGVSTDYPGDVFPLVKNFMSDNHFTYQVVIDTDYKLYTKYVPGSGIEIPHTFFIDRYGNARFSVVGAMSKETILSWIRRTEQF